MEPALRVLFPTSIMVQRGSIPDGAVAPWKTGVPGLRRGGGYCHLIEWIKRALSHGGGSATYSGP